MIPLTLREIRQAIGGKPLTVIKDAGPSITSISIDSRAIEKDSLFMAIRGDKFDGHQFLEDAAGGGAIAAIVETMPAIFPASLALVQVPSTRVALGRLAKHVRQQLRVKVIAVAGSNGKTSTKHLIHAALRKRFKGTISPKSYNNDIGVPLAIFPAEPTHDYLVLEMGTNHPGEIKPLSDMAIPDFAVITNCGAEHLEGLNDLAGVRRENAQVISGLNPRGVLIVNGDDSDLLACVKDWRGKRITFGLNTSNDLFATNIQCMAHGTEFSMNGRSPRVFVPMLGKHSAINALAAIAVARSMRVPEETFIASLAESDSPEMRLQLQKVGTISILNDAYNANPNSMRAAIETLSSLECRGRRVAVLGDMRELGATSERYHREIGEFVAKSHPPGLLICVGIESRRIAVSAREDGYPPDAIIQFDDASAAASELPGLLRENDLVLLKASRGIGLEKVANAVAKQ